MHASLPTSYSTQRFKSLTLHPRFQLGRQWKYYLKKKTGIHRWLGGQFCDALAAWALVLETGQSWASVRRLNGEAAWQSKINTRQTSCRGSWYGIGLDGNLPLALNWIVDLPRVSQGQGITLETRGFTPQPVWICQWIPSFKSFR